MKTCSSSEFLLAGAALFERRQENAWISSATRRRRDTEFGANEADGNKVEIAPSHGSRDSAEVAGTALKFPRLSGRIAVA
ncbi:MAG: hypothetical protein OXE84_04235 [Rhodobacteraceae bacterium]|nr:hypothetical protein [Paracoccaceae bacterium]MCY4195681.1 hypothetical protein [Paracoccaceae bacterium]MCY4326405.1 hypothetical protein [Paracoccaceae bacterium]